ncbi:MAG: type II secretion system F family protein [Pseudomonadota bacterium]
MFFQPLIYGLIFISVYLMLGGMYFLVFGQQLRREKRVNRRLALLQEGRDTEEVLTILRTERETSARSTAMPIIGNLVDKARHANIVMSARGILAVVFVTCVVIFVLLTLFTVADLEIRIVAALFGGYGTVYLWLRGRAKARISLFEEQLPDALDLMVRSLRVGHPINAAIAIVAREMPDPLGTEFGLIADEATYGMAVNEALERLAERVPVQDLRFLAIAVTIQASSGGNMAEILDGLAKVIRARFKLFRKVRAITAEARFSGWILSIFPIIALLGVQFVDPNYYTRVDDHPYFMWGAVLTGVLLVLNIIFMRILLNIKV